MVRLITSDDIPGAMRLKEAANWNQTETDWRNILRLAPEGCFGIDCEGRLAATATAACFGSDLAWIGMVLTAPEMRGRGLARALMEHAIAYLEARRISWIKLDATDMGRPLYAKLGFVDECPIERWGRQPAPCIGPEQPPVTEIPLALDREATGADRSEMLTMLAAIESASLGGEAYAMGRAGTRAAYFGPCVSQSPGAARELLRWYLARHASETVYWDILPDNAAAVQLARESGFEPLRRLVRMARPGIPDPPPFIHNDCHVFAIAGFEYG
jgi:GNAT superfamily N-acetyltransferase